MKMPSSRNASGVFLTEKTNIEEGVYLSTDNALFL
jgi:hypothetical protein